MQIATITVQLSGTPLMLTSCHGAISRHLVSLVVACIFLHLFLVLRKQSFNMNLVCGCLFSIAIMISAKEIFSKCTFFTTKPLFPSYLRGATNLHS